MTAFPSNSLLARAVIAFVFLHALVLASAAPVENASPLDAHSPSAGELMAMKDWMQTSLLANKERLPFSFVYNGSESAVLLGQWKSSHRTRSLGTQRREHTLTWTDIATGLKVSCVAVEYSDFPVVEWTVRLKNTGKKNTPIVENIQGLSLRIERSAGGEFVLHGNRGDSCVAESYQPFDLTLGPGFSKRFSPPVKGDSVSGKSSDGPDGWPYFNLQKPDGGVIIAVGWPGQWEASFTRDRDHGLQVNAGQQLTHLYLKPGEEIRTPLIALLFWEGADVVRAQNLWRAWYLRHNLPRINGKPQPPVSSIQVNGSLASWPWVEDYLRAGIKPDLCWRDAGGKNTWYPSDTGPYTNKMTWLNTGTWEPDPGRYPQGFKPFSNKVRALGMQFVLWFEPERVGDPNSWLAKNHPEWLLPGNSNGSVLNEGNPQALSWLIHHVDGMIKSQGLDWYREDLNGAHYGTAWRKNDAPDRQGITENLYVQGHLAFWDELRRRNPKLHIDSCASGGRRNDLETMRRAVPLLRSDFQFPDMKGVVEGNQGHTYGISSWLPWNGCGLHSGDSYALRSFLLPGYCILPPYDWTKSDAARAVTKKVHDEFRRVAPLLLGDYYPLTSYSLDTSKWIAWQFHRPDLGESVVQAFRRPNAESETLTVRLRGLEPNSRYEVENLDGGKETRTGFELMNGLEIRLASKPAAAVLVLRKVRR